MLTVAVVESGNYLGRGAEYVARMESMVRCNLPGFHSFVVLTDSPERHSALDAFEGVDVRKLPRAFAVSSWWAKIALFEPGLFEGRVMYTDLDAVVVGNLQPLAENKGIIHLRDWGWKEDVYGSGSMTWDAGEHREIWDDFGPQVMQSYRGDQDYLTALGGWRALPKGLACSYRYVSKAAPPEGCRLVHFHGKPKPHEVKTGWVPAAWASATS